MNKRKEPAPLDLVALRKKRGLNQSDFWSQIGVTQSGGSRYENGRNMPKPVRSLVELVHVAEVDHPEAIVALIKAARKNVKTLEGLLQYEEAAKLRDALNAVKKGAGDV